MITFFKNYIRWIRKLCVSMYSLPKSIDSAARYFLGGFAFIFIFIGEVLAGIVSLADDRIWIGITFLALSIVFLSLSIFCVDESAKRC